MVQTDGSKCHVYFKFQDIRRFKDVLKLMRGQVE